MHLHKWVEIGLCGRLFPIVGQGSPAMLVNGQPMLDTGKSKPQSLSGARAGHIATNRLTWLVFTQDSSYFGKQHQQQAKNTRIGFGLSHYDQPHNDHGSIQWIRDEWIGPEVFFAHRLPPPQWPLLPQEARAEDEERQPGDEGGCRREGAPRPNPAWGGGEEWGGGGGEGEEGLEKGHNDDCCPHHAPNKPACVSKNCSSSTSVLTSITLRHRISKGTRCSKSSYNLYNDSPLPFHAHNFGEHFHVWIIPSSVYWLIGS